MPAFGSADVSAFLADHGVAASRGTFSTTALFDSEDAVVEDGSGYPVQVRRNSVLIARGGLGTVAQGDTITVGGTAYNARFAELEPPDQLFERITFAG